MTGGLVAGGIAIAAAATSGYLDVAPLRLTGLIGFCLLGALFPDVDTDSKGQNLFYGLLIVVDGALIYYRYFNWAAWLGLCAMLPALGHHRGWTHTWWAMIVVGAPIAVIPVIFYGAENLLRFLPFYISFTIGYFSHLLLDRKFI